MVMTHSPAYHFWKFLMKNMIQTNSDLRVDHGKGSAYKRMSIYNLQRSLKLQRMFLLTYFVTAILLLVIMHSYNANIILLMKWLL